MKPFRETIVGRILNGIASVCTRCLPYLEDMIENTRVGGIVKGVRGMIGEFTGGENYSGGGETGL
jgi:hypothetical protein